ncbi:hypothetical protein ADL27_31870 [Streptomyces sp. NRRL F-6602]|nr:hypothetical protein ADL27_31870 [Streptomyces sp. NRRL F-6602]
MSARDDVLAGLRASEDSTIGDETPEQLLDRFAAEVRAAALRNAADRIERRAAQLGGVWLQTEQVCATLRLLAEPEGSAP